VIAAGSAASDASRVFVKLVVDPGLPQPACAAKAREFHDELERIVDDVAALRPPNDVQALQDRFVSAAGESVATVGRAADEVAAGKLRCGTPMNRRIYGLASTRRAEQVLQDLARKGYVFGLNSSD
jgi:hypothetical protein